MPVVQLLLMTPTPVNPSSQDPCPCKASHVDPGLGHETNFGPWAVSKRSFPKHFHNGACLLGTFLLKAQPPCCEETQAAT